MRAIKTLAALPPGIRAPCFSLTTQSMWALEILVENGFTLDSVSIQSYMPYGIPGFGRHAQVQTPAGAIQRSGSDCKPGRKARYAGGWRGLLKVAALSVYGCGIRRINEQEGERLAFTSIPGKLIPTSRAWPPAVAAARTCACGLRGLKANSTGSCLSFPFPVGEVHDSCDVQSRAASVCNSD